MPDPTHGRYLIPTQHVETELDSSSDMATHQRRVFFNPSVPPTGPSRIIRGEDVTLTADELKDVKADQDWIYYKVWEMKEESLEDRRGRGVDVLYVHGYREYGQVGRSIAMGIRGAESVFAVASGRYAYQCRELLKAGFRVIIVDMPGVGTRVASHNHKVPDPFSQHGRSTGVHGYVPSARSLPDTVFTVLQDHRSSNASPPRKTFLTGSSMGGLTVLYALTLYDGFEEETRARMPPIHGALGMCPLLDVPDRPNAVVTAIGKLLSRVAGKVPLLDSGPLDNISDDERVPAEFRADPMNYTGKLRIATGLAFLHAFTETVDNAAHTKSPIRILHGDADRTTSHKASMTYIDQVTSADKSIKLYENHQHVMVKVIGGKCEEADFERNQAVMDDWKAWLLERV